MHHQQRPQLLAWPPPEVWRSILCGLSGKLAWDPKHTVLCHLAQIMSSRRSIGYDEARTRVDDLIVQHVHELGVEFGLGDQLAAAICDELAGALWSLRYVRGPVLRPCWPSREEWLAIDQTAAGYAFMDPSATISTNLARFVANQFGVSRRAAKQHVHRHIARHARQLTAQVGLGWLDGVLIQWRLNSWLNSFDSP